MLSRLSASFARLWKHPFARQVSGMMMYTAAGQGLYLAAGPFIGRLFSPEQVGLYGLFMTIWMLLGLYACGLYELAIPSAKNDEDAALLSTGSLIIGVCVALLSGGALTVGAHFGWFGLGGFPLWVGAVAIIAMLAQTLVLLGQAWSIRRNTVMKIGSANMMMNGLRSLLQVAGGFFWPFWWLMTAAEIVARGVQAKLMDQRGTWRLGRLEPGRIARILKVNKRFPLVFGPAFAIDSAAMLLQTGMIGMLFGAGEMGQYFIMRRTLDLPVAFAFKSLSDLFFARILELVKVHPERLHSFLIRSALTLALAGLVVSAPIVFFGPELFTLFYGPAWSVAGILAAIMVPPMVINLAVAPVSRVFQISKQSHLRLVPGVVHLAGTAIVLWLAQRYQFTLIQTAIGISIASSVQYCVYFGVAFLASNAITSEYNSSPNSRSMYE